MESETLSIEYLRAASFPVGYNLESGIYFLFQDQELVYIGQAACLDIRILNHITESLKEFNRVAFLATPAAELDATEAEYINKFRPKYNKYVPSIAGYFSPSTLRFKFSLTLSQIKRVIKKHQPHNINGRYQIEEIRVLLTEEGYL